MIRSILTLYSFYLCSHIKRRHTQIEFLVYQDGDTG